jgi:uracil-DNA glycosylase
MKPDITGKNARELQAFLDDRYKSGIVYPPKHQIFAALNAIAFGKVRVVILGQDPYIGHGQANGLSFSVNRGVDIPPSLQNIFEEVRRDTGARTETGDLTAWAKQGVLLLNTVLTVQKGLPNSHEKKGWEYFTTGVIQRLNHHNDFVVFLFWGRSAQEKIKLINSKKHLILTASHPSPKSANMGSKPFVGCKHFSQTNAALKKRGFKPINWDAV